MDNYANSEYPREFRSHRWKWSGSGRYRCKNAPAHEYLNNNLEFTLDREPDNRNAGELLDTVQNQDPNNALITRLGEEKEINAFFRLCNPTVISRLREAFHDLLEELDSRTVFVKLRELGNS